MKICKNCGCSQITQKTIQENYYERGADNVGYAIDLTKHIVGGGAAVGITLFAVEALANVLGVRARGGMKLAKEVLIDNAPKRKVSMNKKKRTYKADICVKCGRKWNLSEQDNLLAYADNNFGIKIDLNSEADREKYVRIAELKESEQKIKNLEKEFMKSINNVISKVNENSSKNSYKKLDNYIYITEITLIILIVISLISKYYSSIGLLYFLFFTVLVFNFLHKSRKEKILKKEEKVINKLLMIKNKTIKIIKINIWSEEKIKYINDNIKEIKFDISETYSGKIDVTMVESLLKAFERLFKAKVYYFKKIEVLKNN